MLGSHENSHKGLGDRLRANREAQERPAADWAKHKAEWLEDLQKLYHHLQSWMSGLEKHGLVVVHAGQEHVVEPRLGRYVAPHLQLVFPFERKIVTVATRGMLAFDTAGVVSVSAGPAHEILLHRTHERHWVYIQRATQIGHRGHDETITLTSALFDHMIEILLR